MKSRTFTMLALALAVSGCASSGFKHCCSAPPPPPEPIYDAEPDYAAPTPAETQQVASLEVHFRTAKWDLSDEAMTAIDRQIEFLRTHPRLDMRISGNCDERGSRAYNYALGMKRADAVRMYMIRHGIQDTRLEAVSLGEDAPRATGTDAVSFSINRRVDGVTR